MVTHELFAMSVGMMPKHQDVSCHTCTEGKCGKLIDSTPQSSVALLNAMCGDYLQPRTWSHIVVSGYCPYVTHRPTCFEVHLCEDDAIRSTFVLESSFVVSGRPKLAYLMDSSGPVKMTVTMSRYAVSACVMKQKRWY